MIIQKYIIPIVIVSMLLGCFHNENWEEHLNNKNSPIHNYDSDFIRYVLSEEMDEAFKRQKKFESLNTFSKMFKIKDESLLKSEYLKKQVLPSGSTHSYERRSLSSIEKGFVKRLNS